MVEVEVLNPLGVGVNVDGVVIERGGGGTSDYDALYNKPSINGVELEGNKTTSELGIVIPANTSDLNNDSGFITGIDSSDVTTALGYTPYNASNPSGYVNASQAANAAPVQSVNGQTGNVTVSVPTKVSQLQNDSGYLTTETDPTVPSWAKEANPPQYELTYDPLSSTGLAQTGDAVTNEPNYTPAGSVSATINWEYKNNKLYIYGINTTFSGNGVRFAVEQETE